MLKNEIRNITSHGLTETRFRPAILFNRLIPCTISPACQPTQIDETDTVAIEGKVLDFLAVEG